MKTVIIAEKGSQARDIRAAVGDRLGQVLPAEGHLLRLAEPEEVDPAWQRWSFALLKPEGLYPTKLDRSGNKPAKFKVIQQALKSASRSDIEGRFRRACQATQARLQSTQESAIARPCGCYASRTLRSLDASELDAYRATGVFNDTARAKALAAIDACQLKRPI